jgi:hypothetical protein
MIRALYRAMRQSLFRIAVTLVCVAGASCASSPQGPDGLDLVVAPIDTLASLGAWLGSHGRDSVSFDAPAGSPTESICRTAKTSTPVLGQPVVRFAVFYIPDAPPGEAFPPDTARYERRACPLRAVWLVRQIDDSVAAWRYADSLDAALTTRLGAGRGGAEIAGLGTGAWRRTKTWSDSGTRVVLGVEPATDYRDEKTGQLTKNRRRVIVAAYGPKSGLGPTDERLETGGYTRSHFPRGGDRELQDERADSALALSGVEPIVSDLRQVVAHTRARRDTDSLYVAAIDSILARVVMMTKDSLRAASATRRAATLLATDLAIDGYAGELELDTASHAVTATRHRLQSAGVPYADDAHSSGLVYTRSFLWDAYRADSLGPPGRLAFIELLYNGWSTKPGCADGPAGYDRVIAHGEAALKRGPDDPLIHFYVGEAYRDVYSLAHGGGEGHVNAQDFASRAESARRQAIEHLTTALKTLRQHPVRHAAWDDAIRLVLRAHTEPSFFCIYD